MYDTNLVLGGKEFTSRLIVGTGKYCTLDVMREAHEASGAEIITVARASGRACRAAASRSSTTSTRSASRCCPTRPAATRPTRRSAPRYLAREAGLGEMVKLEVIGDSAHAVPRRAGAARGHADAGPRRLHRHAVHERRSGDGQEAAGRGRRLRDAAGGAHRLRARDPQPVQHQDHPGVGHGAGHRGRRRRHAPPMPPSPWSSAATACS